MGKGRVGEGLREGGMEVKEGGRGGGRKASVGYASNY